MEIIENTIGVKGGKNGLKDYVLKELAEATFWNGGYFDDAVETLRQVAQRKDSFGLTEDAKDYYKWIRAIEESGVDLDKVKISQGHLYQVELALRR